jgi:hypothetical protein
MEETKQQSSYERNRVFLHCLTLTSILCVAIVFAFNLGNERYSLTRLDDNQSLLLDKRTGDVCLVQLYNPRFDTPSSGKYRGSISPFYKVK